jgi:hypothetical protein
MGTFKDHFCSHAEGYAAYRPTYPAALIDFLVSCAHGSQLACRWKFPGIFPISLVKSIHGQP